MDAIGADPMASVIGIDVALTPEAKSLNHPRIRLIEGSSTDPETVRKVKDLLPAPTGLVSLDPDHSCDHILRELEIYHELAAIAGHLVVEDANINGHPAYPSFGPGLFEAVTQFLNANHNFVSDDALWWRNHFSFHQYGWLLRVK